MRKHAKVDSLNLSSRSFEHLFVNSDKYKIITIKSIGIFDLLLWLDIFGKPLERCVIEAKIIFTNKGLKIALKRYAINPHMQRIEFAGLQGYNERSNFLRELLKELLPQIQDCFVRRCDVCFDYKRKPLNTLKYINEKRRIFQFKNTTYYKTEKEKKTNSTIDIKFYNKQLQANLDNPLYRLEFVFKGAYFRDMKLYDLEKNIFKKCKKTILNFSGINSKISLLS